MYKAYLDYISRNKPFFWAHRPEIPAATALIGYVSVFALLLLLATAYSTENFAKRAEFLISQYSKDSADDLPYPLWDCQAETSKVDCVAGRLARDRFEADRTTIFVFLGIFSVLATVAWFFQVSRAARLSVNRRTYAYPYFGFLFLSLSLSIYLRLYLLLRQPELSSVHLNLEEALILLTQL